MMHFILIAFFWGVFLYGLTDLIQAAIRAIVRRTEKPLDKNPTSAYNL